MDIPAPPYIPPSSFQYPPVADNLRTTRASILTEEELARFKDLLIFAKSQVEGYFSGKHKSRFYGSSAEFCDYKEYMPGDDVERVDWRRYGRTRRLFVRRFQEETDMVVYLLVDTSGSMSYSGPGRQPKIHLASKIAAALSYLMVHQGDKAALTLFSDRVYRHLPASGTRRHLYRIVSELEHIQPCSSTGLAKAVTDCDAIFKKRGCLVILSDFLDDTERIFEALGRFMRRDFEILLMQILDPDELNLPSVTAARFTDLESGRQVTVEPESIRRSYQRRMKSFVDGLARESGFRRIAFQPVDASGSYLSAIEAYLGFRTNGQAR